MRLNHTQIGGYAPLRVDGILKGMAVEVAELRKTIILVMAGEAAEVPAKNMKPPLTPMRLYHTLLVTVLAFIEMAKIPHLATTLLLEAKHLRVETVVMQVVA